MVGRLDKMNKDVDDINLPLVDISEFEIETEPGVMIKIQMIRPKDLPKEDNAAYMYAHGGGAVVFDHLSATNMMAKTALNLQCVVFNVDYRLGPEALAPKGQCDFAAAVRHVSQNATKYGIGKD